MLKITNDHRWTSRTLRKQEWKIKNVALRQRVMAVRLVMEGYLGKDVAAMLHLCRQSVAFYVSLFNEGGLDLLLDWKSPPGREPFLTPEQQQVHSVGTSLLPRIRGFFHPISASTTGWPCPGRGFGNFCIE
jgi:hypothetical protein